MREAANEAQSYQRQVSREAAAKAVSELKAGGMQYNDVVPEQQKRMRQIAQPALDTFTAEYDPNIVELYKKELARIHQ